MNPVKAGLVDSLEQYPYCFQFLANKKAKGARPPSDEDRNLETCEAGAKALDP
jgi:hypothetical protein